MRFEINIDLSAPEYNALASCCKLRIDLSASERWSGMTNLSDPSKPFYSYSEFENCNYPVNHAPKSVDLMFVNYCVNKPSFQQASSFDTFDFDSLSYELVSPLFAKDSSMQFNNNYYAGQPVKCYYPGSFSYPYSNPKTDPPIGFYFDSLTGELTFTGTQNDTGPLTVLTKEWRKNASGSYVLIGEIHREIWMEAKQCQNNNPPEIDPPYHYNAEIGKMLCFNITCNDAAFVPPPPDTVPPPDSVRLSWNRGIPGASFTILDPTARLQTARFCWTPTAADSSSAPYTFMVMAKDNNCPFNAVSSRQFTISTNTLGIYQAPFHQLHVYPNPASGSVHLSTRMDELILINPLGIQVLSATNAHLIDISDLPSGIYFLYGKTADQYYVARIVVENQ